MATVRDKFIPRVSFQRSFERSVPTISAPKVAKTGLRQRLTASIKQSPIKWGLGTGALVVGALVGGLIYFFQSDAAKKIAVSEAGKGISEFMGDNKIIIVAIAIGAVMLIFMKMRKS